MAPLVSFGRVVKDHVENDLESGVMEGGYHCLEFTRGVAVSRCIARIRRKKSDRVETPGIQPAF
jgi:hypothetical protein